MLFVVSFQRPSVLVCSTVFELTSKNLSNFLGNVFFGGHGFSSKVNACYLLLHNKNNILK